MVVRESLAKALTFKLRVNHKKETAKQRAQGRVVWAKRTMSTGIGMNLCV